MGNFYFSVTPGQAHETTITIATAGITTGALFCSLSEDESSPVQRGTVVINSGSITVKLTAAEVTAVNFPAYYWITLNGTRRFAGRISLEETAGGFYTGDEIRALLATKADSIHFHGPQTNVPQIRASNMVYFGQQLSGLNTYSGGTPTLRDSTDFAIGSESVKIVTPGSVGVQCGAFRISGPTLPDFTGKDVILWLKVTGMANAADFKFWLGGSGLATAYTWNLSEAGTEFPYLASGNWYRVTLPLGAAVIQGSAPNLTTLNSFQLAVYDNGTPMTVQFGGFGNVPQQNTGAVVTIRMDDLPKSNFTNVAPYLAKYGFRANAYAIAETLFNNAAFPTYCTLTEAHKLEDMYGWEICSHSYLASVHNQTVNQGGAGSKGYLAYNRTAQIEDMYKVRQYLETESFHAANHFAWPQGAWDEAARVVAGQLFSSTMTLAHAGNETVPVADPSRIRCYAPPTGVTGAQLTAEVDKAILGKEWLTVLFHNVVASPAGGQDISLAAFQTFVDYLATNNVSVKLVSEVLATRNV